MAKRSRVYTPPRFIVLGFGVMILLGTLLLCLPAASRSGQSVGFVNALFTATSANCVTGLVVVNTSAQWTLFGQAVILVLIQLGGLGFMSVLTLGLVALRQKVTLKSRLLIQASFNQASPGGMVRLVKRVLQITLTFELCGAALLAICFYLHDDISPLRALWNGLFHAVAAFCNSGFDLIGAHSLMPYQGNLFINLIIGTLVVSGGLGFPVWIEVLDMLRKKDKKHTTLRKCIRHLSVHSKITFCVTGAILLFAFLFFLLVEWRNPQTIGTLAAPQKLLAAAFQAVSIRTAGYSTINQDGLTEISKFIFAILMTIGGGPASTAGGIKTVTVGVIFFTMVSVFRGQREITAFGRSIPLDILQRGLSVAMALLSIILSATVILYFTERDSAFGLTFMDLLFEACSAVGTSGISTGITMHLSTAGKLLLVGCMFVGRLSPITLAVALSMKLTTASAHDLRYVEERVIIG